MVLTEVAIGGLTRSMEALSRNLKDLMDFADRAQRASLALGTTYEQTRVQLGGTMEGLRGDINQRFAAGIAGLEAGLQGNTAGVAKLINQQQLTNTAFGKTATTFAQLESVLNLSRDETNRLASSLIETGAKYQISTDKLVGVIDALKDTFPAQALAGMGDNIMAAVTQLQGELGPQLAGPLNNVMRMIMDTSMEGYANLIKLGIGDVRERLSAAKDENEARRILIDAFITAEGNFRSLAGDAKTFFPMIGIAQDTFGKLAIYLTTIVNNLGKRIKNEVGDIADYGKTLRNLKNEIFVPFLEGLSIAYPFFLEVVDTVSSIMNTFGQRFKDFAESLGGKDGASETMKNFKLAILDFSIDSLYKMEGVFTFMKFFITEGVPNIFNAVKKTFDDFVIPGGPFDQVKLALLTFAKSLAIVANVFGGNTEELQGSIGKQMGKLKSDIFMMDRAKLKGEEAVERQADIIRMQRSGMKVDEIIAVLNNPSLKPKTVIEEAINKANIAAQSKKHPMYLELVALRERIENNEPLLRKTNEELNRLNETQDEMNRKIPEQTNTFLDQTATLLAGSMESILGLDQNNTLQETLENLNDTIEANARATASLADVIQPGEMRTGTAFE